MKKYTDAEAGQTTVEYLLVVLLVAIVLFLALKASDLAAIVGGAGDVIGAMILEAIATVS